MKYPNISHDFPWIQAEIRKEAQKRAKERHSERPLVFLDIEVSKRGILGAWDFKQCYFSGDFWYFSKGTSWKLVGCFMGFNWIYDV